MTPNDPYYVISYQFTLIGDIETIWDDYSGAGVRVGVYDDGIDYTHADLAANYDASLHFSYGGTTYDPFPASLDNGHGTAVAGLVGAAGMNGQGGLGVAWGCSLTGVDFLHEIQLFTNTTVMGESLAHAKVFDIMSNSWGRSPDFATYNNANYLPSFARVQNEKYQEVVEVGRGGLGTIIVQAAGNDTSNANGDAANSTRFTASVAAADQNGDVSYYSNFGTNILVAAPSSNLSTDIEGAGGYVSGDYIQGFGATSAATPIVSGAAALMLEANPDLGWRDVQNILATSASHTGSDWGAAAMQYEVGAWFDNGATTWNGGGMSHSLSYGFGMVDAYAAVRMAEVWSVVHGPAATSANEITASFSGGPLTLIDGAVVSDTLSCTTDIALEHVEVTIDVDHSAGGDLTVELISPGGAVFTLFDRDPGWDGAAVTQGFTFDAVWSFGVTGVLGLSSLGNWALQVTDTVGGGIGTIFDWTVDFFGAAANVDDVYHYTQDFLDYAAVDAGRAALSDTNGGQDWLELTSVAGAITADLETAFSVGGVPWATLDGSVEHIAGGDGDDWLGGTADANTMLGGRGSDTLIGGLGDDVLTGGAGGDVLQGGGGRDVADYGSAVSGLVADLLLAGANTGDAAGDSYQGIDGLTGSAFADTLRGGYGAETLDGGAGGDMLVGRDGDDLLRGGDGHDLLRGGKGADRLEGGAGRDFADYTQDQTGLTVDFILTQLNTGDAAGDTYQGMDGIYGSQHDDILRGSYTADTLEGGAGDDMLEGREGNDLLKGADGDDTLRGGRGADRLEGGAGRDLADYGQATGGVVADLILTHLNTGEAAGDTYQGIDGIQGSTHADILRGGYGAETLVGRAGNDVLTGRAGDDRLEGGQGNDLLTGGPGADIFTFDAGHDTVTDFGTGDALWFDDALWGGAAWDAADILATASTTAEGLTFTFTPDDTLTLTGIFTPTGLEDDIFSF